MASSKKRNHISLENENQTSFEALSQLDINKHIDKGDNNFFVYVRSLFLSLSTTRKHILETNRFYSRHKNVIEESKKEFKTFEAEQDTSRKKSDKKANFHKPTYIVQNQFTRLPELLNENLWQRHGYSISDIRKTLNAFDERTLWKLILTYSNPATNSSTKIEHDEDFDLKCDGRTSALSKFIKILKDRNKEWDKRPSVTNYGNDKKLTSVINVHIPSLPVHTLSENAFLTLKNSLSNKRSIYAWKDILVTPFEINPTHDIILMYRVLPWDLYYQIKGLPKKLTEMPNYFELNGTWYAFMDEAFFFYFDSTHSKNQNEASSSKRRKI